MPTVKVGDIKVSYERQGTGFPILFIAGLSAGKDAWIPVVEHLKHQYECITFDNRGIGESSRPASGYTPQDLTNDALGLMDCLSLSRVHIVGQSMGGTTAQLIALERPELVHGLILVGSSAMRDARTSYVLNSRKVLQRSLTRYEYFAFAVAPWFFGRESLGKPGFIDAWAKKLAEKSNPQSLHAYNQLVDGWTGHNISSQLKAIIQPTLVMVGEEDILTLHQSRMVAESIPGAELLVLPGLGHSCIREDLEGFVNHVASFLKRVDAR
jgi:pimeloyl-ACP methyl ester carboxylesterase